MSTPPPTVDDQDTDTEPDRVFTFTDPDEDGVPDFYENEDVDPGSDEETEHYAQRWAELGLDPGVERTWTGAVDSPATPLPDPVASSSTSTPSIAGDEETFATVDRAGFDRAGSISADEDFRRVMDSYRSMDNDVPNAVAAPVGENTGSYDDMRQAVNDALADTNDVCMVPAEPSGLASGAQIVKDAVSYDSIEALAHLVGSHIVEAIEQEWWDWDDTQGARSSFDMGGAENMQGEGSPATEDQVPVPTPAENRVTFDRIQVVQGPDAAGDVSPDPIVMTTLDSPHLTSHVARIRQVESLPGHGVLDLLKPVLGLGTVGDDFGTVEEIRGVIMNLNPHQSLLNRLENAKYGNHLSNAELGRINWVSSSLSRFVSSVSADMYQSRAPFLAANLKRLEDLDLFDEMVRRAAFDPRYLPDLYEMSPESAAMVSALIRNAARSRSIIVADPMDKG